MDDQLKEFIAAIVSESVEEHVTKFMNEFEEKLDNQELGLDMAKLRQDNKVIVIKMEMKDKALAIVHKDDRFAIDINPYDPNSGLIPISKEAFDKFMERGLALEQKYNRYNVTVTGDLEDKQEVENPVRLATAEQEELMLDSCMKILDTIDGKQKHYQNLRHKSFGHVTVVEDDDKFVMALTCSGRSMFGSIDPSALPLKYSKAVTDAMYTVYQAVNQHLKNTIPEHLKILLPIVNARFNELSAEERKRILEQIRKNRS